jgi:putative photosynthetic complex assembly protein
MSATRVKSKPHDDTIPRPILIGAGVLMAASILLAATAQWQRRYGPPPPPTAQDLMAPVEQRTLLFVAGEGEAYTVFDKTTGAKIGDLERTDGFIRTLLQSLNFDRRKLGLQVEETYILSLWPDGRITFDDPTTGTRVNTGAFGQPTKDRFYRFLENGEAARAAAEGR